MTDSVWSFLATVAAALISGVAVYYASRAEKNSRPVGNGFASAVLDDLRELRELLAAHVAGHADTPKRGVHESETD